MTVSEQVQSLERAVQFGLLNGKRNVIADLVPLDELFQQRLRLLAAVKTFHGLITRAPANGQGWRIMEFHDRDLMILQDAIAAVEGVPS